MQSSKPSPEFRNDINGLRALSVALVVFFHVGLRGADGGFLGVDIFFVISGFLMTRIIVGGLHSGSFSYWRFLVARAARIWPALGAMVVVLLVLGAFLLPPFDLLRIANQAGWALVFWSNQVFHDHAGYATQGADGNWFLHTWSLSVEWQFYMLYPLMLMLLRSRRSRTILLSVVGVFALSLVCYLVQSTVAPNSAFFLLPARAWEMLAGGLVALTALPAALGAPRQRQVGSYMGIALILLSALWLGYRHMSPVGLGWLSVPPVVGAMLVLWSAYPDNLILSNRAMQAIGRWSYSIYLWHWPLVVICAMDDALLLHPHPGKEILVLASVLLGALSYRFVESRRTHRSEWLTRLSQAKPVVALGTAGVLALIAANTGGLEFRMPRDPAEPVIKAAEESDYFPAECGNFQKELRDVRPCTIDKHSGRAVLVIGDSLAEHLYPWFKTHTQVTVDFLTESECPPVPRFDRLQPGFHCMDYANEAWRQAGTPRYDTVIISGNWTLIGGVGPPYCRMDDSGACNIVSGAARRQQEMLEEMRKAIDNLLKLGKNVVFLDNAPETTLNVPQRLARERFWFGAPRMTISTASVHADFDWIDTMLAEFKGRPGFHLVSVRPLLCGALSCKVYDAALKRPVYLDGRHFDPVWITRHGDIFAPFVGTQPPARP